MWKLLLTRWARWLRPTPGKARRRRPHSRTRTSRPWVEQLERRELLAAFTPGNLVIYRVGDGSGALTNAATPVFLDEYTTAGTLVQSIPLPTTVSGSHRRLTASGTATSEGLLTLSPNGQFLAVPGYDAAVGTANVATQPSSSVNRTVAIVDHTGAIDTTTALNDTGNNNHRSAVYDGSNIWVTTGNAGIRATTLGGITSTQLNGTLTNIRQANIFDGQLYISTGSGSTRVATVGTGTPITSGQTITNLPGFPTAGSPYAFFFADLSGSEPGVDTLYVADDTTPGQVQKWTKSSGTWGPSGTITLAAVRGLTGTVSGTTVTLYVTAGPDSARTLSRIIDSSGYGGTLSGSATTLATAATNTVFRGVAFVPVSGGSPNGPPVNTVPGPQTINEDTNLTFTGTISISDPDAGSNPVQVTLTVTNGILTLSGTTGLTFSSGSNGSSSMTFTGTIANINNALNGMVFTPNANFNGTSVLTITTNDQGHSGTGGPLSDTDSVTITINAVNDAPVNSVPGSQSTPMNTNLVFSTANGNLISISDVDANSNPIQVTLSVTNGLLTLSGTTGLTFSAGDGTADATMTFTGTLANINAALNGMFFAPNTGYTGPATLTVASDDQGFSGAGGPLTDTDLVAINVAASPNGPPVNTVPGPQSTNEDTNLTFTGTISIADPDAGSNPVQVTLTVTNGVLTLSGTTGLTFSVGDGTADATMTFTGTIANINAALNNMFYTPMPNFNGTAVLTITTNDLGHSGSGGPLSDTDSVTITVNPVNVAPVSTVPGPQTVIQNGTLTLSGGSALSVADIDAGSNPVEVTLTVANGVLTLSGTTGLTFSVGDGTADATMTFTGTIANINAALNGMFYNPNLMYAGPETLTITVNDLGHSGSGGPLSDTDTVTITVLALPQIRINEVFANPPGTDAPNEYVEIREIFGASVTFPTGIYLVFVEGDAGSNQGDVQNIFDLSGKSTGSNGFLVLAQKSNTYTFHPAAQVYVNSGSGAGFGNGPSSSIGHTADGTSTDIENPSFTVFLIYAPTPPTLTDDIDSDNNGTPDGSVFASWTILDSIGVLDGNNAGDISYGAINFIGGSGTGTSTTGTNVNVAFNAQYVGRIGNSTGSAPADWVASDSLGGTAPNFVLGSAANTEPSSLTGRFLNHLGTVNFSNQPPVNTVPGPQSTNEDTSLTFTGTISIADPDAGSNPVQVTLTVTNGVLTLSGTTGLTFSVGDGTADATMTFTGTMANINAALNGMFYTPTADFSGTAVLTITTNDQGNTGTGGPWSDTDTVTITVNAVNDAPVNTVPGPQSTNEDTNLTFTGTVSISDVDAGSNPVEVTLTVTNGILTLSGTTGLTFSVGDGTADATMTFTGTMADINAALNGMFFAPNANFAGTAVLTITTNDQGHSGSGGPLSDTDLVTITVNAVNDAPVNTVPGSQSTNEDTNLTFTGTVSISDVDAGSNPVEVTLTVTNGVLTLSGTSGLT
ncbi:MAG: cadherin-like domain-containing protein, partial [Gemmataceae bacterium]|nr:cadherin-like domain-containing protein [Gemmataceae bacterium]